MIILIAYFFGGIFLSNGIPHFVSGVMGLPFQSPFAKPPGRGLSSSRLNVIWGFANFVMSYGLVIHVGHFDLHVLSDVSAFGLGALLNSLMLAQQFGRIHGGNHPTKSS